MLCILIEAILYSFKTGIFQNIRLKTLNKQNQIEIEITLFKRIYLI